MYIINGVKRAEKEITISQEIFNKNFQENLNEYEIYSLK